MKIFRPGLLALCLLACADPALAHRGHQTGLSAGLMHPLTGLDHLLAMLLVGGWATLLGSTSRAAALSFTGGIAAGIAIAVISPAAGLATLAEAVIIGSLLVLGAGVLVGWKPGGLLATAVAGLFGLGHGLAHGWSAEGMAMPLSFGIGVMVTTAALLALGHAIGTCGRAAVLRALGAGGAFAGLALASLSLG